MPFSEKIKIEVKKRSTFQCCRCHYIGIEAHHILPEAEGGHDTIDNAAPLCPSCHSLLGANPEKRKEIKQMRDWWYEVVSEKYSPAKREEFEKINEKLQKIQGGVSEIDSLNKLLVEKFENSEKKIESLVSKDMNKANAVEVVETANSLVTATRLGDNVYSNFMCKKCGTSIGMLVGSDKCPDCGTKIGS